MTGERLFGWRGNHPAERPGGGGHAIVIGDDPRLIVAELLCSRDVG